MGATPGLEAWYEPSGDTPRLLFLCFLLSQKNTPRPIRSPSPNATPMTMPTTLPVLTPPPLLLGFGKDGLEVAAGSADVGVTRTVLTFPVTVIMLVKTRVSVSGGADEDFDCWVGLGAEVTTSVVVRTLGEGAGD